MYSSLYTTNVGEYPKAIPRISRMKTTKSEIPVACNENNLEIFN